MNGDGTMQETESGIASLTLHLTSTAARSRGAGYISALTDASGYYRFANVPAGTYLLTLTQPGGYLPTTHVQVDVSPAANTTYTVNFGLYPLPYRNYLGIVVKR